MGHGLKPEDRFSHNVAHIIIVFHLQNVKKKMTYESKGTNDTYSSIQCYGDEILLVMSMIIYLLFKACSSQSSSKSEESLSDVRSFVYFTCVLSLSQQHFTPHSKIGNQAIAMTAPA